MKEVDTIIVGAGTAGLSALREVRRATDDVLLVNDGHWGTTCAMAGCMPSKALIEAANAFHRRHALAAFGITGAEALGADVPAVLARVRALRDGFVEGPASTPRQLGERALSGRARLSGPGRIAVNGEEIAARAIILAPGSRPIVPGPWRGFGARILTTDSLFDQADLPRRIAVIGMGAIGIELAQALARLGIAVAGFDAIDGLAGIDDPRVLAAFRPLIEAEIALHLGAAAELEEAGDAIRVSGATGAFEADAVLAAMGRRPNVDDLGLETLGVPLDDDGLPEVDPATLRIGDLPVFLAGDANGYRPLLHEAADEGFIAGRMAAPQAGGDSLCRRTPLAIVFSSPQVARVGPPLSELDGEAIASASADFSSQARARMAQRAGGMLRIHAERASGRIVAAEMCVPAAEHLAHLLALAVERGMTVADVLATPFYHPVLEEGLRSALRRLSREVSGEGGSDLSSCAEIGHDALD
ncbi:dihydrolipoyl dehydrogenase [Salinarimonas sp.]|uniref:dihydrolipoyl dehydrogenase n=1 Tax=Salinarimonas sp. TaxID=2766526 RepID=UPI0032D8F326